MDLERLRVPQQHHRHSTFYGFPTHALETHKTLSGDDVVAVLEGAQGPLADGRPYTNPENIAAIERYHLAAVTAHAEHKKPEVALPILG